MSDPLLALPVPNIAVFFMYGDALAFRQAHGGWIFRVTDQMDVWFDLHFKPTDILQHPMLKGMEGTLI